MQEQVQLKIVVADEYVWVQLIEVDKANAVFALPSDTLLSHSIAQTLCVCVNKGNNIFSFVIYVWHVAWLFISREKWDDNFMDFVFHKQVRFYLPVVSSALTDSRVILCTLIYLNPSTSSKKYALRGWLCCNREKS